MASVSALPTPKSRVAALPGMDLARRLDRLRGLMGKAGCDALLISNLANVRYLSGFSGSAGMLFVTEAEAVLVTDGRYTTQAALDLSRSGAVARVEALPGREQPALLAELAGGLGRSGPGKAGQGKADVGKAGQGKAEVGKTGPGKAARGKTAPGKAARGKAGRARIGLEAEHVPWARRRRYADGWAKHSDLVPTSYLVEQLRQCKEPGEVARIAAAAAIADEALARVRAMLEDRPSEVEVAIALDGEMRLLGAEAPAFETIVASGPNAAEPHHHPSARRIPAGELVVVDFGARVDGYCSDMTRTVRVGEANALSPELRRVAAVVLASQDAGLCAVRAGIAAAEVDRACREVVAAAGWAELFVHGTGHGVGLDIHEAPSLAAPSEDILCSGQVVTVEPGVYIPGLGGARTEDTVVVTDAGCEVLTLTPKQASDAGTRRKPRSRGITNAD
jgi:Xaa-Pro aminopeptidase